MFKRNKDAKSIHSSIDSDGLPYVGQVSLVPFTLFFHFVGWLSMFILMDCSIIDIQTIHPGEPFCSIYDKTENKWQTNRRKGSEPVIVDYVAVDMKNNKNLLQKVSVVSGPYI